MWHPTTRVIISFVILAFNLDSLFANMRSSVLKKGPHKVYRIYPTTNNELDFLVDLWTQAAKHQLNFWKDPSRVGSPTDIMVPSYVQPKFEDLLKSRSINYTVTIQDVKKLILERESNPTKKMDKLQYEDDVSRKQKVFFDFQNYHDYNKMRAYMRTVEKQYPEIAKVYNLGYSHENRPIEMIKIGYPLFGTNKRAIWIDAGIHAREWASHSTAMYFIHQLVTRYGHDPAIDRYVQNLTWYIVPVVNPDGYAYTRTSVEPEIRMWRKNRSPNTEKCHGGDDLCCKGVDLNRNFDFHWGEAGASSNPCDETFAGTSAFSEPEARAIRDFVSSRRHEIDAMITLHTYSQFWIHSYGHRRNIYPDDVNDLKSLALAATKALERLYGTQYKIGSGADVLYPAAGGSDDWAKSKLGVKYVYLLELRPEETVFDGFILDSSQLIPCGRETWAGVKVVANKVLEMTSSIKEIEEQNTVSNDNPIPLSQTIGNKAPATTVASEAQATAAEALATAPQRQTVDTPAPTRKQHRPHARTHDLDPFAASASETLPLASTSVAQTLASTSAAQTLASTSAVQTFATTSGAQTLASALSPGCYDLASESRCSRWMYHRVGICERIVEYMTKNCAKSCGFCNKRKR